MCTFVKPHMFHIDSSNGSIILYFHGLGGFIYMYCLVIYVCLHYSILFYSNNATMRPDQEGHHEPCERAGKWSGHFQLNRANGSFWPQQHRFHCFPHGQLHFQKLPLLLPTRGTVTASASSLLIAQLCASYGWVTIHIWSDSDEWRDRYPIVYLISELSIKYLFYPL